MASLIDLTGNLAPPVTMAPDLGGNDKAMFLLIKYVRVSSLSFVRGARGKT